MQYQILFPLILTPLAAAHCKITGATGDAGGKGTALGMIAGSGNSEADVTVYRSKTGFGATPGGGAINPASAMPAAMQLAASTTPPQVSPGGTVKVNMHVVNQDGAGPMSCYVSSDASGQNWAPMQVTQNVPGFSGISLDANKDYPVDAQMPAGTNCTGSVGSMQGVCMVKCQNPIGPFGGTVPVQMAAAGAGNASGAQANTAAAAATSQGATAAGGQATGPTTPQTGNTGNAVSDFIGKASALTNPGSLAGGAAGGAGGAGGLLSGIGGAFGVRSLMRRN